MVDGFGHGLRHLGLARTRLGMRIRAGASNREMVRAMGVDIRLLYRVVFAVGVALAALAGMIASPVSSVYPGMGSSVLIICFVVVVIGGIGSIKGALVAALLVGFVDTFGKVLVPGIAGVSVYLLMAVIGGAGSIWGGVFGAVSDSNSFVENLP